MAEPAKEKKRVPEFVSFEEALDALYWKLIDAGYDHDTVCGALRQEILERLATARLREPKRG